MAIVSSIVVGDEEGSELRSVSVAGMLTDIDALIVDDAECSDFDCAISVAGKGAQAVKAKSTIATTATYTLLVFIFVSFFVYPVAPS